MNSALDANYLSIEFPDRTELLSLLVHQNVKLINVPTALETSCTAFVFTYQAYLTTTRHAQPSWLQTPHSNNTKRMHISIGLLDKTLIKSGTGGITLVSTCLILFKIRLKSVLRLL